MERYIRILSLCLAAALTVPALVCCAGGGDPVTEETTKVTAEQSTAEEAPEVKKMVLIDDNGPLFTVEEQEGVFKTASEKLRSAIEQRYRCALPDNADLRIGFEKGGGKYDWRIKADGHGITVTAENSTEANRAVERFLRAATSGSDTTLSIPYDLDLCYEYEKDKIDNSALLSYKSSDKVSLIDTAGNGKIMSPDWIESLIMVELRPLTASIGGRLKDSYDLLDFYAELGVNCIWLTPIYEYGPGGNGYGNTGAHRIGENLTGTSDQEKGWEEMRKFVDYAHGKGIYILFDVITWGVMKGTELTVSHPEWFSGEAWGNAAFNWKNGDLKEWFISTCVENIEKTGADGFRCDCEPNYTGYDVFGQIRQRLSDKGKYIIIISEDGSDRRRTYDFEQDGVLWYSVRDRGGVYRDPLVWYVDGGLDIVESVKKGTGLGSAEIQNGKRAGKAKYYTNCITNHDYQKRIVLGNRLNIGYAAITAPFIPLWYMGDEFNCGWQNAVQYDMTVSYEDADKPKNRAFLEDVKRMIAVRRTYKEIFEYWPDDHRQSNICAVELEQSRGLTAYARYAENKAVLILPNNDENASPYITAKVPFAECGIDGYKAYRVTDLWTGDVMLEGDGSQIAAVTAYVPYQDFAMILIEGIE
ncbi:MAG: hypothetical protein J5879_05655 [Clostridia bacterium]|nr:hypothetical protein [Clostridia bacterium]